MIIVWIIAILLVIPTYGISLVVAFIIGALNMKFKDEKEAQRIADAMLYNREQVEANICIVYHTLTNFSTKLSDREICEIFLTFSASISHNLRFSGMTLKERNDLAQKIAFDIMQKFYENYDKQTARKKANEYLFELFESLKRSGEI